MSSATNWILPEHDGLGQLVGILTEDDKLDQLNWVLPEDDELSHCTESYLKMMNSVIGLNPAWRWTRSLDWILPEDDELGH